MKQSSSGTQEEYTQRPSRTQDYGESATGTVTIEEHTRDEYTRTEDRTRTDDYATRTIGTVDEDQVRDIVMMLREEWMEDDRIVIQEMIDEAMGNKDSSDSSGEGPPRPRGGAVARQLD